MALFASLCCNSSGDKLALEPHPINLSIVFDCFRKSQMQRKTQQFFFSSFFCSGRKNRERARSGFGRGRPEGGKGCGKKEERRGENKERTHVGNKKKRSELSLSLLRVGGLWLQCVTLCACCRGWEGDARKTLVNKGGGVLFLPRGAVMQVHTHKDEAMGRALRAMEGKPPLLRLY